LWSAWEDFVSYKGERPHTDASHVSWACGDWEATEAAFDAARQVLLPVNNRIVKCESVSRQVAAEAELANQALAYTQQKKKPIADRVSVIEKRIRDVEREENRSRGMLRQEIESLRAVKTKYLDLPKDNPSDFLDETVSYSALGRMVVGKEFSLARQRVSQHFTEGQKETMWYFYGWCVLAAFFTAACKLLMSAGAFGGLRPEDREDIQWMFLLFIGTMLLSLLPRLTVEFRKSRFMARLYSCEMKQRTLMPRLEHVLQLLGSGAELPSSLDAPLLSRGENALNVVLESHRSAREHLLALKGELKDRKSDLTEHEAACEEPQQLAEALQADLKAVHGDIDKARDIQDAALQEVRQFVAAKNTSRTRQRLQRRVERLLR